MLPSTRLADTVRAALPLLAAVSVLAVLPAGAAAQDGFLFRSPAVGLTLRAGPSLYTARSDVFDSMRRDLTLDRGDFRAPAGALELSFMPGDRVDIVIGAGYSRSRASSEFRDWVGSDDLPIEQVTRLETVPMTASLRYHLVPKGRSIGTMAWLPRSTTPYVGAGAGVAYYRLEQDGEFVDFADNRIFGSTLESSGSALVVHGMAGVDHWITPRFGLNAEVRYTRGSADPQDGFRTFDRIDVGGVQATIGISARW
jgi:hypothetical protein